MKRFELVSRNYRTRNAFALFRQVRHLRGMVSGICSLRCLVLAALELGLIFWGGVSSASEAEAKVVVHTQALASNVIPRNLTGKFCEHLGANIYNGMDAQILRNPTFADFPFSTGQMTPDGLVTFHWEREKIDEELRRQAQRFGWPESEIAELVSARHDGLGCFWSLSGARENIEVSPDTGPRGGRAQRIGFKKAGGIKQWAWLPLHRTRKYEFELLARSPKPTKLSLFLCGESSRAPCASAEVGELNDQWKTLKGTLVVASDAPPGSPYCLVLSTESAGQLVVGHLFLWPADHINGADPDVVRFLKEANLPLLRWPGGNFVSAYHWEDGVGPTEARPTLPNYAWGGVEPNTFGTDEFISFCRAVGCEPMICINAGTGTPEEAARWVEYCNGLASSPMGARRAANGHPEPYRVRHWEVGNELWGHWQAHWTTPDGYPDRYLHFARAMHEADPTIQLYACGAPVLWGKNWNDRLIQRTAAQLRSITDHPLIGGDVPRNTEPLDVFRDFMLVLDILEQKWRSLRNDMVNAGVHEPRLAVTELQMFAHLGSRGAGNEPERLSRENLVNPGTLGEALYDTLIYHAAVRLQPFLELVTHSATVNHGGGLRKERERVYANPCYYANALFSEFANARPVRVEVTTSNERAPLVLPDIRNRGADASFAIIDAVAAASTNGDLLVSLVNRGTQRPVRVHLSLADFAAAPKAKVVALSASNPWSANTLEHPEAVRPEREEVALESNSVEFLIKPFSLMQVRLFPRQ